MKKAKNKQIQMLGLKKKKNCELLTDKLQTWLIIKNKLFYYYLKKNYFTLHTKQILHY